MLGRTSGLRHYLQAERYELRGIVLSRQSLGHTLESCCYYLTPCTFYKAIRPVGAVSREGDAAYRQLKVTKCTIRER